MQSRPLPPKYITVNGVMKVNPEFAAAKAKQGEATTVANPAKALAIVSTPDEMMAASQVMEKDKTIHKPIEMAASNTESTVIIQDPDFLEKFKAPKPIEGGDLLDKLCNVFAKYEVPMGLINKLLKLAEYKLNFIMDDSGSMNESSDVTFKNATPYVQKYNVTRSPEAKLTRWQEAEDRLHILIDLIGFIPTNGIVINYLNETDRNGSKKMPLVLNQTGKNPEDFITQAHKQISDFFANRPTLGTPIYTALKKAFAETKEATMHYLFTDGEPSDATPAQVAELVTKRNNPTLNPLTLISCSDQDTAWMKEVEEEAKLVAELDDFHSECKEVLNDQGPVFPYSKGMWLVCNLIAAVCPNDLDAIDESIPFTKCTIDNLLGRKLNPLEYQEYFNNNPNAKKFTAIYQQFLREDLEACAIVESIKKLTGIKEAKDIDEKAVKAFAATLGKGAVMTPGPMGDLNGPPSYNEAVYGAPTSAYAGSLFATAPSQRPAGSSEYKTPRP